MQRLRFLCDGKWLDQADGQYIDVYNPSTGKVLAQVPSCNEDEVNMAIEAASRAYKTWSQTPAAKRVQVLYKFRTLVEEHLDELTVLLSKENGKVLSEARGDVLKVKEAVEHACGIPSHMMGESLMNVTSGYDTVLYRESVGVFAGIAPFNFPAMIPMGWMMPLCIATGNTFVLKASSLTPMSALRLGELLVEAGLPNGVVNIVACNRNVGQLLLEHPDVKGITFVGTTGVGLKIYEKAAKHGKRVQALCEAKNHALVLEDAAIERTARGIINASFGCAGERCMALPVVVVQESIADKLVSLLVEYAKEINVGIAYDEVSTMGPVISSSHKEYVTNMIQKGLDEGAKLVLDGRGYSLEDESNGYYLAPSIFDHVTQDMSVGRDEIFGPVLCIKRVKDFEEGINVINSSAFANGSTIFTQNGYYSREFARRIDAGMVGINVGIPVPMGVFPFTGHKDSFFGSLHTLGKDGVRFFTETKAVTTRWFDEEEMKKTNIDTWDGTL